MFPTGEKMTTQFLKEEFGRKIVPGDSFMRIESRQGGANIRYYFLAGFADDGRIHVQEYCGVPRTIKSPSEYSDTLILLTDDLLKLKNLTPPVLTEVVAIASAPPGSKKKRATKATTLEV